MIVHRASWVLPVTSPPIRDGWVAIDRGRIAAVGGPGDVPPPDDAPRLDPSAAGGNDRPVRTQPVAILPGLVNAHTHLELSWMRGRVAAGASMPRWAERLMALRRTVGSEPAAPIADAVREVRASGTALLGEVTNTLAAYAPLADSHLSAVIFRELLGFNASDASRIVAEAAAEIAELTPYEWLRPVVVPHAPYSVSPALLHEIACASGRQQISIHLGESVEEVDFLRDGSGAWTDVLQQLGVWTDTWQPPACGRVDYLDQFGLLTDRLIAVHCVQLEDGELGRLAERDATVVTCPRSNRWTGAGTPPVERFYHSGVRVAVGTDSLASVDDLSVFSELAELRRIAPEVGAARLIRSATLDGAHALGFGSDLGSITPGKRAELIAVDVPPNVTDVEEYLIGGVRPQHVRWLGE